MQRAEVLAAALLALGLVQLAGDLAGIPAIKGIGAATCASPAPKVFSAVKGLETYSTRFYVEWTDKDGAARSVELTPDVYCRMCGPYNRRNAYGAALAYGPVLASEPRTRPMLQAVMNAALSGDAPLLSELGIDTRGRAGAIRVRYEPCEGSDLGDLPRVLEVP